MDRKGTRRKLSELEHQWLDAVRTHDIERLDRLLGEEFTLTTGRPGNEVRSRQEYMEVAKDRYLIESFEFEELEVLPYGHVAVVRSRYRQTGSMVGEDRSQSFLMTDVWVRRAGRWQAVTRHLSPLVAESAPQ
jgi:ketosteroid isomerase-like protein